jgi:hypothetical protein
LSGGRGRKNSRSSVPEQREPPGYQFVATLKQIRNRLNGLLGQSPGGPPSGYRRLVGSRDRFLAPNARTGDRPSPRREAASPAGVLRHAVRSTGSARTDRADQELAGGASGGWVAATPRGIGALKPCPRRADPTSRRASRRRDSFRAQNCVGVHGGRDGRGFPFSFPTTTLSSTTGHDYGSPKDRPTCAYCTGVGE